MYIALLLCTYILEFLNIKTYIYDHVPCERCTDEICTCIKTSKIFKGSYELIDLDLGCIILAKLAHFLRAYNSVTSHPK